MKLEIKLQKFFPPINFIPQLDGHYFIKLSVIRKSPQYRSSFQHNLAYCYDFVSGKEK